MSPIYHIRVFLSFWFCVQMLQGRGKGSPQNPSIYKQPCTLAGAVGKDDLFYLIRVETALRTMEME